MKATIVRKKLNTIDPDNEETINLIKIKKSQKKRRFIQIAVAGGILVIGAVVAFIMYPHIKPGPDNIRTAEKAMKENDYDVAVKELSRVIWVREDDASLYKKRAEAYLKRAKSSSGFKQKNDLKNAVDDANMAMKLNPDGNEEDIKQLDKLLQDTASETGDSYLYNASLTMGNTVMNLENDGLIVCDLDGTTYVANSPEVGNIKRVDVDGKETVIYKGDKDDPIAMLNLKGDGLIFQLVPGDEINGKIIKVSTDGSDSTTLFEESNLDEWEENKPVISYSTPIVLANRIYLFHGVNYKGGIYSSNLNGGNLKKAAKKSGDTYPLKQFFGADMLNDRFIMETNNQRFLFKRNDDNGVVYSLDADGKEAKRLIKIKGSVAATVQGDNIYVCNGPNLKGFIELSIYNLNGKLERKFELQSGLDKNRIEIGGEVAALCVSNNRVYYEVQYCGYPCIFGNAKLDGTDNRVATNIDDE